MTNESGEIVFDQDYLPFGGDLAVVGDLETKNEINEGYKYTGQRQEPSIGLYYYGARFYDPELGRFITEDIYVGEIVDSQSQNIYIYTLNNPMKYVDPTGNFAIGPIGVKTLMEDYKELEASRTMTVDDLTFYGEYYNVQEGDTLSGIVDMMYDTSLKNRPSDQEFREMYSGFKNYTKQEALNIIYNLTNFVADINQLNNKNSLKSGQKLFIPDVFNSMYGGRVNRYNKIESKVISLKGVGTYVGAKVGESTLITTAETVGNSIRYFKNYSRNGLIMTGIRKTFNRSMKELPKAFSKNFFNNLVTPVKSSVAIDTVETTMSSATSSIASKFLGYGFGAISIVIGETKPVGEKPINQVYSETPYTKYGIFMNKNTGRMRYLGTDVLEYIY